MSKKIWFLGLAFILVLVIVLSLSIFAQKEDDVGCFFFSSLHYTNNGLKYWYSKENGGFEKITNIPIENLDCKGCHIASCDVCHKKEKDGKFSYSKKAAKDQNLCLNCHGKQKLMIEQIDKAPGELDVHFAQGMECMDCHTAKDVHGDGVDYSTLCEPGAIEAQCENCHEEISSGDSHKIHQDKLDCSACHTRRIITCYSCHFEKLIKEKKSVSIPITDWVFLINHDGKVTSGNIQSVVYQGNTFVSYSPFFSHSVMKEGRKCDECHASDIVKRMKEEKLKPVYFENGEVKSEKGVIPLVDGKLEFLFFDYQDGKWVPLKGASSPVIRFTPYGKPITKEQFEKLSKKVGK